MKRFIREHPIIFSVLFTLSIVVIYLASFKALGPVVAPGLSPDALATATEAGILALALALITYLGWWRQVGFNKPVRWRSLLLLWYPMLVIGLTLLGGVRVPDLGLLAAMVVSVLIGAFMEDIVARGILWRALVPSGVMRAAVGTSLLFGSMHFLKPLLGASLAETIPLGIFTICGGFTYAALRYRTGSIWPPIQFHVAFNVVSNVATFQTVPVPDPPARRHSRLPGLWTVPAAPRVVARREGGGATASSRNEVSNTRRVVSR